MSSDDYISSEQQEIEAERFRQRMFKRDIDAFSSWASDWIRVFFFFAPMLPIYLFWYEIDRSIGIEIAALIAIVAQMVGIVTLTDGLAHWAAEHYAKRNLKNPFL